MTQFFLAKYTEFLCYQLILTAQEHPPPPRRGGVGGGLGGWVGGWVSLGGWVGCLVLRQPHRDPAPPLLSKGLYMGQCRWIDGLACDVRSNAQNLKENGLQLKNLILLDGGFPSKKTWYNTISEAMVSTDQVPGFFLSISLKVYTKVICPYPEAQHGIIPYLKQWCQQINCPGCLIP